MKTHVLIIDPQNSFCDPRGELYVPRAEQDMDRLARYIRKLGPSINRITVTLDSHNRMHIAHPVWWIDENGNHPAPFTAIAADDLREERYTTTDPRDYDWSLSYLEKTVPHVIWPMHCLIGTWGHEIFPELKSALNEWGDAHTELNYLFKGPCRATEHFSAVKASVEVPGDPGTQMNTTFVESLEDADIIYVGGEASSHCVADTVTDLIDQNPRLADKITLLRDCMSPVSGFEHLADRFFSRATASGVRITDAAEKFGS